MRLTGKLLASASLAVLSAAAARAQVTPAQMGVLATPLPEVLQVLDSSQTWVPMGTIDPVLHQFSPVGLNLVPFWAAGDGVVAQDGVIAAGSANLSSASHACVPADVGRIAVVAGGGASDGSLPLHTTVASCAGATMVLAAANQFPGFNSATPTQWSATPDYSAALNAFVAAHKNAHILLPCGTFGLDAASVNLNQVWLQGCGAPGVTNNPATAVSTGTTIAITANSTARPAFVLNRSIRTSDFNIVYPGNWGVTAFPVAYGPTFTDVGGAGTNLLTGWYLDHVTSLDAYDFFVQSGDAVAGTDNSISTVHWDNVKAYSIHHTVDMSANGEEFVIASSAVNSNISGSIANLGYGGHGNLRAYTWNYGAFYYGRGSGADGAACSAKHAAVNLAHVEIYGVNDAFQLVGSAFPEAEMTGVDVGNVNQFISADAGSEINGVEIAASIMQLGNTTGVPMIDYRGNCTGVHGSLTITGDNWIGQNGGFVFIAGNMTTLTITGNKISTSITPPTSPQVGLFLNDPGQGGIYPGTTLVLSNNQFISGVSGNLNAVGVGIVAGAAVSIVGNTFKSYSNDIDLSGQIGAFPITVMGNTTVQTGNYSLLGGSPMTVAKANNFDGLSSFNLGAEASVAATAFLGQDATMTPGSNIMASASRACTFQDVPVPNGALQTPKIMLIAGAGAPDLSAPLHTTVTACQGGSFVLADPAQSAVNIGPSMLQTVTLASNGSGGTFTPGPCTITVPGGTLSAGASQPATFTGTLLADGTFDLLTNTPPFIINQYGAYTTHPPTTATAMPGCGLAVAPTFKTSYSGDWWAMGLDQSANLASIIAANRGSKVTLPVGNIILDSAPVPIATVRLEGSGSQFGRLLGNGNNLGTTLLLTSNSTVLNGGISMPHPGFLVGDGVRLSHLNFLWPGQTGLTPNPIVYGPLFSDDGNGTKPIQNMQVDHVTFANPYDLFAQTGAYGGWRGSCLSISSMKWTDFAAYVIHDGYQFCNIGETVDISNVDFNPNAWPLASTGNRYLAAWSGQNGYFIEGVGPGYGLATTAGAASAAGSTTLHVSTADATSINAYLASGIGTPVNGVSNLYVSDKSNQTALASAANVQVLAADIGTGNITLAAPVAGTSGVGLGDRLAFGGACTGLGGGNIGGLELHKVGDHDFVSFMDLQGALLNESTWSDIDVGSDYWFLKADAGSRINDVQVIASKIQTGLNKITHNRQLRHAVDYNGLCQFPGGGGSISFTGDVFAAQGGAMSFDSDNLQRVTITGGSLSYVLAPTLATGALTDPLYAVYVNDPTMALAISGVSSILPSRQDPLIAGVTIVNADRAAINGNVASNVWTLIDTSGMVSGALAINGNMVEKTPALSGSTLTIPDYTNVVLGQNNFDRFIPPTVAQLGGCTALQNGKQLPVLDALNPVWNGALTGGGTGAGAAVLAYCNGTGWTAH